MRDNQFYERLNQIRSKYGYANQNQPQKQANLAFNKPQLTIQSYRETMRQNEPSPRHIVSQNVRNKNYKKAQIQKNYVLGISPNRNLKKERSLMNKTVRVEQSNLYKQQQTPRRNQQNEYLQKIKTNCKNTINENLTPSPIKKLGAGSSYQSSPIRKNKVVQKVEENQVLKPYNRANNYAPIASPNQPVQQRQTPRVQKEGLYQRNRVDNTQNKSFREEISFQNKVIHSARNNNANNGLNEGMGKQSFDLQDNISKDSFFMQKFTYNVKNIEKIQDKINSLLNRQK